MTVNYPTGERIPIVLHLPHSGTYIPNEIYSKLDPVKREQLDETDWFLDKLYDFCSGMGITVIKANYHRWVADLNRDPANKPLYADNRVITSIVPITDFNGDRLYKNENPIPSEIDQRIKLYHEAYFTELHDLIKLYLDQFGKLILWDGHSIRRSVPGIQEQPFPDMILGTDNDRTLPKEWIQMLESELLSSGYHCTFNTPFRGGYITRSLADPAKNVYTVQMEMSKDLYMDDSEINFSLERAETIKPLFKRLLTILINKICQD